MKSRFRILEVIVWIIASLLSLQVEATNCVSLGSLESPTLEDRLQNASQPFTTASVISNSLKGDPEKTDPLFREFQKLIDDPMSATERAERLMAWIASPDHANYFVENLSHFKENAIPLLKTLLSQSPYFLEASAVNKGDGSLVTFGYDVEGGAAAFLHWYKLEHFSDEAWNDLPLEERYHLLRSGKPVVPTALCPPNLGELKWENKEVTEVAHRALEINLERALAELDKMAEAKFSEDGIHFHLVSEFPAHYPHLPAYIVWSSQKDDLLIFKNLEQGRFPDLFVGIAKAREPKKESYGWHDLADKMIPMGIRVDLGNRPKFGKPVLEDSVRISHELRDASKKLAVVKQHVRKTATELIERPWEHVSLDPANFFQLGRSYFDYAGELTLLQKFGFSGKDAVALLAVEPLAAVPLIEYEKQTFFNFEKLQTQEISLHAKERVRDARLRYLRRLRETAQFLPYEAHLAANDRRYEKVKKEIRSWVVHWAWLARVSELYPEGTEFPREPIPESLLESSRNF